MYVFVFLGYIRGAELPGHVVAGADASRGPLPGYRSSHTLTHPRALPSLSCVMWSKFLHLSEPQLFSAIKRLNPQGFREN